MNQVIDKQIENAQVQANMNTVNNIINGVINLFSPSNEVELAVAA